MRYVMMTFVGTDHAEAWRTATPEERQAEVDRTIAWFREHGAAGRIVGGEELGDPAQARTLRRAGVTDGPFIETKELLGGFIVLDVPDEATALRGRRRLARPRVGRRRRRGPTGRRRAGRGRPTRPDRPGGDRTDERSSDATPVW